MLSEPVVGGTNTHVVADHIAVAEVEHMYYCRRVVVAEVEGIVGVERREMEQVVVVVVGVPPRPYHVK